jgi:ATPases involved in chromosome partitioning
MGRIIAILNQKGGSGKTTTAVNLGAYLATLGKTALLVDLDPQANSTVHLGLRPHEIEKSVYDVMMDEKPLLEVIQRTEAENLFIAPANIKSFRSGNRACRNGWKRNGPKRCHRKNGEQSRLHAYRLSSLSRASHR